ncbi:hypothetical protein [Nostoc sp.]
MSNLNILPSVVAYITYKFEYSGSQLGSIGPLIGESGELYIIVPGFN